MSLPIPHIEPDAISAGDTVNFKIHLGDFLPSDGWYMQYSLRGQDDSIDWDSTPTTENEHGFLLTSEQTAELDPGPYKYALYILGSPDTVNAGYRQTLRLQTMDVLPDLESMTGSDDPRSWAQKGLEIVENVILGRITSDILSYSFMGRSVTKMSPKELRDTRDYFQRLVDREKYKAQIAKGKPGRKNIGMMFLRPATAPKTYRGFGQ